MSALQRKRIAAVAVSVVAGVVVAAGPADAIAGGTPAADGAYGFVAKVASADRACTGVLVHPQWVLTASSCFAASGLQAGPPPKPTTITVGRTNLAGTAGKVVRAVIVVPRADRNLTLVKLDDPIAGITPIDLATTAPVAGETLRAAGYGRTATEWVPDRLQTAPFTAGTAAATTLPVTSPTGNDTCLGDSGGPLFRETGGRAELLAINVASWQHGCLAVTETRQGGTGSRVDGLAGWIQETRNANKDVHLTSIDGGTIRHNVLRADGTWQGPIPIFDGAASQVSTTVMPNGDLHVVSIRNGSVYHDIRYVDGTWQQPVPITDGAASQVSATAMPNGDLHLTTIRDGEVYHNIRFANGVWQGPIPILDGAAQQVSTTVMPNGDLHLATIRNGEVYHNIRFANGDWQGPIPIRDAAASQVSATAMPNGDLHLTTIKNGNVYHNVRRADETWQGPIPILNGAAQQVSTTVLPNGDLHLATINGGVVYHNVRRADGTWQGPVAVAGSPGSQTSLSAV